MSDRVAAAFITFFAGVGVIIGVVLVVYAVTYLADRFACTSSSTGGALTLEEFEERQNASLLTIQSGLAGLLTDERNQIYRVFFDKRSFPYHEVQEPSKGINNTKNDADDLEAQKSSKKGRGVHKKVKATRTKEEDNDEASGELPMDDDDGNAPSCSICLNEYQNGDKVILGTGCSHMFHYDCCMQWVDKGNEHCPYCRENMISAQDLSDTATEVVGEERVAKLQRINQEAALRVAALTASGTRTISEVVPPVGRAPATTQQANFPVVSTPPSPAGAVVLESAEAYQTEEPDEAETNPEAESSITNNEVEQRSARPSVEDEVADTEEESEESSSDGNTAGSSNDETAEPSSTPTPWEKEADTVSAEGTGDAGPSKDVATKGTAEETQ